MEVVYTVPDATIGAYVTGYVVNASVRGPVQDIVEHVQETLINTFGDAVWVPPQEALHITLLDWLAPLVEYGQDKEALFHSLFPLYDTRLSTILGETGSIEVTFNEIVVGEKAVIVKGMDDGTFSRIRTQFVEGVALPPETKLPPAIIHSTIARYEAALDLQDVRQALGPISCSAVEHIDAFRLVCEYQTPMLDFEVIKEYTLK